VVFEPGTDLMHECADFGGKVLRATIHKSVCSTTTERRSPRSWGAGSGGTLRRGSRCMAFFIFPIIHGRPRAEEAGNWPCRPHALSCVREGQ
jgi:hypothetical protein